MRDIYCAMACAIATFMLGGGGVVAAPSGLNVIPTADVLDKGTISLEYESAGNGRLFDGDCASFGLFQIGLGHGIEVGLDRCLTDPDWWVNIKWQAQAETPQRPALAVGLQGISADDVAQPYLAMTRSLGPTRLHAGAVVIDHRVRGLVGFDRPLGNRLTLQADYTSGDENSLTYGVSAAVTPNLSLTVARSIGNSAETGNGHVLNLAWSISLD